MASLVNSQLYEGPYDHTNNRRNKEFFFFDSKRSILELAFFFNRFHILYRKSIRRMRFANEQRDSYRVRGRRPITRFRKYGSGKLQ